MSNIISAEIMWDRFAHSTFIANCHNVTVDTETQADKGVCKQQ